MKRALFLLALAGCPDTTTPEATVELYATTTAPPAGRATIINDFERDVFAIDLSIGVAIAAHCSGYCEYGCVPRVRVDNSEILDVRPVYLANGSKTHVALIAKTAGETTLTVENACAVRTYTVNIAR